MPLSFFLPKEAFETWGWRIPFLLSVFVVIAGYIIRRKVDETPAFQEEDAHGELPRAPIIQAIKESWRDMLRVIVMALMNTIAVTTTVFGGAFATQPSYGVGMSTTTYLWIPVLGNFVAVLVIPFVGNLSDKVGRKPVFIVGALSSGVTSFLYLYFIGQGNVIMTVVMAIIMWGILYQGYNAVFPAFYQELFPTRTRVSAFAISQNIGTALTGLVPTIYALVAPPGSGAAHVALVVGSITFAVTILCSLAALSARETYRVHMNDLGVPGAQPVPKDVYERIRAQSMVTTSS